MKSKLVTINGRHRCAATKQAQARHKALRQAWKLVRALRKRLEAKEEQVKGLKLKVAIAKPLMRVAARKVRW